jgi:Phytanoyl-CoA dioxygenase (PhyH)
MQRIGPNKISELLPELDSTVFSAEIFGFTGVFVIREAIPAETVRAWQGAWQRFYAESLASQRNVNKYNPVAVDETPPPELAKIHQHPSLLNIIEQVYGPDIGLYNQRFVIKDHNSRGPVFVHNDFAYHLGWPTKASMFVPLSEATPENGGLFFYPGTHQFGYLGDAGELNLDFLPAGWPRICPRINPGDCVLMNSSTWHGSGPHVSGPDRVMADIIYQPANDPSCISLVRGQWRTEIFLDPTKRKTLFNRSRTSRLIEMQVRLDQLEAKQAHAEPA